MSDNMRIIIAPAKKMKVDQDTFLVRSKPAFLNKTQELLDFLKTRDFEQLQNLWRANNNIVRANQRNLLTSKLDKNLTPAIWHFQGFNINIWLEMFYRKKD